MNPQTQILNYLQWTRDRGLYWPAAPEKLLTRPIIACCEGVLEPLSPQRITLLTQVPSTLDQESLQLLERMCAATKIPSSDFSRVAFSCCPNIAEAAIVQRWKDLLDVKPEFVVVLGEEFGALLNQTLGIDLELGIPQEHLGTHVMLTYQPHALLAEPQKKIPAWQHLQTMMRILQK